jgi:glycerol-3-phosphate dehydrogenase
LGIAVQEISADQIQEKFPLATKDDILAGFNVADDGRVNFTYATMALATGASQYDVKIMEGQDVLGVATTKISTTITETGYPHKVTGVTVRNPENPDSPIEISAPVVVNCAGM